MYISIYIVGATLRKIRRLCDEWACALLTAFLSTANRWRRPFLLHNTTRPLVFHTVFDSVSLGSRLQRKAGAQITQSILIYLKSALNYSAHTIHERIVNPKNCICIWGIYITYTYGEAKNTHSFRKYVTNCYIQGKILHVTSIFIYVYL